MLTPAPLSSSGGAQEPRSERGRTGSVTGFLTFAAENVLAPINKFPGGRRGAKRPPGEQSKYAEGTLNVSKRQTPPRLQPRLQSTENRGRRPLSPMNKFPARRRGAKRPPGEQSKYAEGTLNVSKRQSPPRLRPRLQSTEQEAAGLFRR
jgi:hypothetical protein